MAKISTYSRLLTVLLFVLSLGAASLVSAQPQAQVVSLSQVPDTIEGNSVNLWAYVENTGDAYLSDNCFVYFYVTGPTTNGYVGYRPCTANDYGGNTGALIPGEQRWYLVNWLPPQAGAYTYYAMVDYAGGLISPWSAGQCFTITPKIISAQVTSMFNVPDSLEGSRVILWTKVKNTGNYALSDSCFVRIYVRGPQTNNYIGYKGCAVNELGMAKPLAPGEERWYEATWTAPQAGTYTYYASIDYQNIPIGPWSTGQIFKVLPKTQSASITQTRTISSVFQGSAVHLGAEVLNTGNVDLGANCVVRFWVKGPGIDNYVSYRVCTSDEYGTKDLGPLTPGKKRWYSADWTPTQPGQYQYFAVVACDNKNVSKVSPAQKFAVNAKTTTTTTTTTTTKPTQTTLKPVVKWDAAASFKTAKWKAYAPQIWGNDAVDGATYYTKLEGAGDNTYTTYNRYCSFNGQNNEYPDTWHIERKYVSNGKYEILVRGKSTPDCTVGQPINTGFVKLNPESSWKITQVNKCTVSEDTQSSNGVFISTWCMADTVNGIVTWQSGSTCAGCCVCGDGAAVDIEITVEKQ